MTKAPYVDLLTVEERAEAIKAGAAFTMLSSGIPSGAVDGAAFAKFAEGWVLPSFKDSPAVIGKALAAVSLLAGAPIGALAHHVDRRVSGETPEERERLNRIRYYRDLTRQLESGLPGVPA